ncbi:MAG: dihydropteroate synthase [Planctomycetes bacterium]|nr:dihydropteroate synthase [Planctomycetota bacterium]
MGILNVTPDSFSDGGRFFEPSHAVEHARRMVAEGAAIIDIGAESTRPGAARMTPAEQIRRLEPVLPALGDLDAVISIDTTSEEVAAFAISHGADIINDVSAGRESPGMFALAAKTGAAMVLMHMLGEPATMQKSPVYEDVVREVRQFLALRIDSAVAAGVDRGRIIVDPGIGFGKTLTHNVQLLANIGELSSLGCAIMIGVSRKAFIGRLTGCDEAGNRLGGTIAACLDSFKRGAGIFRVHDVAQTAGAFAVDLAIAAQGRNP